MSGLHFGRCSACGCMKLVAPNKMAADMQHSFIFFQQILTWDLSTPPSQSLTWCRCDESQWGAKLQRESSVCSMPEAAEAFNLEQMRLALMPV